MGVSVRWYLGVLNKFLGGSDLYCFMEVDFFDERGDCEIHYGLGVQVASLGFSQLFVLRKIFSDERLADRRWREENYPGRCIER